MSVLGEPADQFDQFLDGPAGGRGPHGLLPAVRFQRRAVQQRHQPGHVLHGTALRGGADRLVRAVRRARRPGQQADQPGDVLDGAVHTDRAQRVDGGLRVLRRPLQHRDQVDDLLQRPVGDGGAHQVADGITVRRRRRLVGVGGGVRAGRGLVGVGIEFGEVVVEVDVPQVAVRLGRRTFGVPGVGTGAPAGRSRRTGGRGRLPGGNVQGGYGVLGRAG